MAAVSSPPHVASKANGCVLAVRPAPASVSTSCAAITEGPTASRAHRKSAQPAVALGGMFRLACAKGLATRRTQSSYCLAFHEDRTGILQVIAGSAFVCDSLYHGGPERLPAALGERARSLGLTPLGWPLQGGNEIGRAHV